MIVNVTSEHLRCCRRCGRMLFSQDDSTPCYAVEGKGRHEPIMRPVHVMRLRVATSSQPVGDLRLV